MSVDYFPQGVARGRAFIGRQKEAKALTYHIEHGHHALLLAESILEKNKRKAVIFFDEVQQLHLLKEGLTIQGAIREFAQTSRHIIFIFSGSNRRILHNMFDDKAMPLYELCERIKLSRISASDYKNYLNKVANESFSEKIAEKDIELILGLTKRHPKRVYNLCYQIWKEAEGTITEQLIKKAWDDFVKIRLRDVRQHLGQLNVSQLKLLTLISEGNNKNLTGKVILKELNITSPSVVAARQQLIENDYIEQQEKGSYHLIDPLVQEVLVRYESGGI